MCPKCLSNAEVGYPQSHYESDTGYSQEWCPASCSCGWRGTTDDLLSFDEAERRVEVPVAA
jgi:hypothetical protein